MQARRASIVSYGLVPDIQRRLYESRLQTFDEQTGLRPNLASRPSGCVRVLQLREVRQGSQDFKAPEGRRLRTFVPFFKDHGEAQLTVN